jgi:hypothetical protein
VGFHFPHAMQGVLYSQREREREREREGAERLEALGDSHAVLYRVSNKSV